MNSFNLNFIKIICKYCVTSHGIYHRPELQLITFHYSIDFRRIVRKYFFKKKIFIMLTQLAEFWKLSSNPHPSIGIVQKLYLIPWTTNTSGGNTGFPRVVTYKSESGGRLRQNRIISSVSPSSIITPNITSLKNQDVHHRAIP